MSTYFVQGSTMDAIADAINAKTGGSSAMTPAQMVTAIGTISGGGSLPSSVSEIAGGSFTVPTDSVANDISIAHSMTTTPKGFVIWTDDAFDDASNTNTAVYIVSVLFSREIVVAANGTYAASYAYIYYRYSDKRISANNGNRTEAQTENYLGADFIEFADSNAYYQAGRTYKWLAWS